MNEVRQVSFSQINTHKAKMTDAYLSRHSHLEIRACGKAPRVLSHSTTAFI